MAAGLDAEAALAKALEAEDARDFRQVGFVGGLAALAYLMRGGDVQTAMAFLQKLF